MTGKPIILCGRPGLGIVENEAVSYVRYSDIPVLHRFQDISFRKSLKNCIHSLHNRCAWEQLFPREWDSHKNTTKMGVHFGLSMEMEIGMENELANICVPENSQIDKQ